MVAEVTFDAEVYRLEAVKKACYRVARFISVDISLNDRQIVCRLQAVGELTLLPEHIHRFKVEVLDQDLREQISDKTSRIREAVLAIAFSPYTKK